MLIVNRPRVRRRTEDRRGTVTVELAVLVPILASIVMGVVEASWLYEVHNRMATAAREGARYAAMDRSDLGSPGTSTNDKIVTDVTSFLVASGIPEDSIDVFIVDPVDHTTPFNVDDPNNELDLFELRIEVPYSSVGYLGGVSGSTVTLSSKIVFRNAPATLVQ